MEKESWPQQPQDQTNQSTISRRISTNESEVSSQPCLPGVLRHLCLHTAHNPADRPRLAALTVASRDR